MRAVAKRNVVSAWQFLNVACGHLLSMKPKWRTCLSIFVAICGTRTFYTSRLCVWKGIFKIISTSLFDDASEKLCIFFDGPPEPPLSLLCHLIQASSQLFVFLRTSLECRIRKSTNENYTHAEFSTVYRRGRIPQKMNCVTSATGTDSVRSGYRFSGWFLRSTVLRRWIRFRIFRDDGGTHEAHSFCLSLTARTLMHQFPDSAVTNEQPQSNQKRFYQNFLQKRFWSKLGLREVVREIFWNRRIKPFQDQFKEILLFISIFAISE